jgi:hypothetical protein
MKKAAEFSSTNSAASVSYRTNPEPTKTQNKCLKKILEALFHVNKKNQKQRLFL